MQQQRLLWVAGLTFALGSFSPAHAQESEFPRYAVSGQVRYRFEFNNKDLNRRIDAISFNLLRTRLGVRFEPAPHTEALLQVQDARVLGEETNTLGDGSADRLDLHQAYFKLVDVFNAPVDIQVGRFESVYGSERFIGAVGWDNVGRSFDGVVLGLHPERATIDVFNYFVSEKLQPGEAGDLNVLGIYGDFQLLDGYTTQAFALWQRGYPRSTLSRYTLGGYVKGRTADFMPTVEWAYQGGTREKLDVEAYMFALDVGYAFSGLTYTPVLSAGIDFLSGDGDPTDGTFRVFDTLYATNHKFYGFMDYFLNIPVHTAGLGLQDLHAGLAITPDETVGVRVVYHQFRSNEDSAPGGGPVSTHFGDEVDLTINFKYNQRVTFVGGASVFAPGRIFDATRGTDTGVWAYAMTIVNL